MPYELIITGASVIVTALIGIFSFVLNLKTQINKNAATTENNLERIKEVEKRLGAKVDALGEESQNHKKRTYDVSGEVKSDLMRELEKINASLEAERKQNTAQMQSFNMELQKLRIMLVKLAAKAGIEDIDV